ncbi:MAG: hypothetical protein ACYS19_14205 [Planctomycetota bacterium]|jgi:hypothetical protein
MYNLRFEVSNLKFPGTSTIVEDPLQIGQNMQNKAKVNIGKMNISVAIIKDYDKKTKNQQRMLLKTKPNKANLHFTAENAEYAEKKDIYVSDCSIEKYALYAISPCSGLGHPVDLRTRRLMKNKAKTKPIKANFKRGRLRIDPEVYLI